MLYNAARCCPTRAFLLTGLYPHQSGLGWMTAADLGHKDYHVDLNHDCRTIAMANTIWSLKACPAKKAYVAKHHITK